MKKIILFLIACFTITSIMAQDNSVEAKAAYLLAEEEFNAAKYVQAIKYLDEAASKLGKANAKILYLKILCEAELAKADTTYYTKALQTIQYFQTAPDINDYNEEKILEITKLKFRFQQKQKELLDATKAAAELKAKKLQLQNTIINENKYKGLRIGMSEEDIFKEEVYSKRNSKRVEKSDTVSFRLFYKESIWKAVIQPNLQVDFQNGQLVKINEKWVWYQLAGFTTPKDTLNKIVELFGEPTSRTSKTEIVPFSNRAIHKNWSNEITEVKLKWISSQIEIKIIYREVKDLQYGKQPYKLFGRADMYLQITPVNDMVK